MKKNANTKPLKGNQKQSVLDFSLLHWVGIVGICLFLFIFPYKAGLFNGFSFGFEAPIYEALILVFILLITVGVYLFRVWRFTDWRAILSIAVLLYPFSYYLSSFQAVTDHYSSFMLYIVLGFACFFILGLYLAVSKLSRNVLLFALQFSGYCIVVYGLLNLFGQIYYPDALWLADTGYRLASVFQYSNTYAGFLMPLFLAGIYYVVHTERWYLRAVHAFMLAPIFISFMLTLSRGALVILPVLALIMILFFKMHRQVLFLIYFVVSAVSGLLVLGKVTVVYEKITSLVQPKIPKGPGSPISLWHSLPLEGWSWLLIASLITTAIVLVVHHYLRSWIKIQTLRISHFKWSAATIPVVLLLIGVLGITLLAAVSGIRNLLPAEIAQRLENINFQQHSVLERETFYRDAMKVVRDYPVLGTGGGGWSAVYEEYQNNPYVSRQAHSFFVQTLVETGWLGFAILMALLLLMLYLYVSQYVKHKEFRGSQFVFFLFAISILAHSAIDFDMSYLYLSAIVFFCLGAMLASSSAQLSCSGLRKFGPSAWRFVYPAFLTVLGILFLTLTVRQYGSNQNFQQTAQEAGKGGKNLDALLVQLDKSIAVSPDHPTYTLTKASWLSQAYAQTRDKSYLTKVDSLLAQLNTHELYNRELILAQYRNFKNLGEYNKAIDVLEEGIRKFQWDINFYEAAIMEYTESGLRDRQTDPDRTDTSWNRAIELYHDILNRQEQLKNLPKEQLQGRAFNLTLMIRQALGQIDFYRGQYQEAVALLQPVNAGDLNPNPDHANDTTYLYVRSAVTFYLASLEALGQNDAELKSKLIQADPDRAALLESMKNEELDK